jgi:hypothetical protein
MNEAKFPYDYIADPAKGRPLFNADLYYGIPDLDPEILANQIQISVRQEDGSVIPVAQPLNTGFGGILLYNGSPVTVLIDEFIFSFKALNNLGAQIYYEARAEAGLSPESVVGTQDTYADVRALTASYPFETIIVGGASVVGVGGGPFYLDPADVVSADNGGTILVDAGGRRWKRIYSGAVQAGWFSILGDGSDESAKIELLEAYIFANPQDVEFGAGTFDMGINSFPFRQQIVSGLKDYKGITIRGAGKGNTIFRTTSIDGADVLQLNGVKGLKIRDLSVTATISGSVAGSNGLSITNGGEDIDIDIDAFSCPGLDKGSYLDGGKGFSIQVGTASNPLKNVKIRGRATNCTYAADVDAEYEDFDTTARSPMAGIDINIVGDSCWRGVTLSAPAAVAALTDQDKDSDIKIVATLINCTQNLTMSRWVKADIRCHVSANLPKASLFRPFAADLTVYGVYIVGDYYSRVSVSGSLEECDNKVLIGGTTQGGGVAGASVGTILDVDIESASTIGTEVSVINSGGNTTKDVDLTFKRITDASGTSLIKADSSVTFGASKSFGALTIPRVGQAYNTFTADSFSGDLSMIKASSSPVGGYAGYVSVKDSVSGIAYKLQLFN